MNKKDTPLRLLHLLAGQPQGGAEGFALRLVLALASRGIKQAIITRPETPRIMELQDSGVSVQMARFGTPWMDFKTRGIIKNVFNNFAPNVVMSYMNRANAFSQSLKNQGATLVGRLGGYYDLKYYRAADYLIGNTEDLVAYFKREGWPAERSIYLPNFAEVQNAAPIARAAFATPDDAPLFLALGRFHDNKGFDTLLNALAIAPGAYLWLAGDGELRSALEAQVQNLDLSARVRFLGWRTDAPALYAAADYFICPSRHEPLGNVMLEAMAYQKPIIATHTAGAKQLLQDGVTGKIVPIDDATAMASAMLTFIHHPAQAQEMGWAAARHYAENYAADIICDRYVNFFQTITGKK